MNLTHNFSVADSGLNVAGAIHRRLPIANQTTPSHNRPVQGDGFYEDFLGKFCAVALLM